MNKLLLYTHIGDDPIVAAAQQLKALLPEGRLSAENQKWAQQVYYAFAASLVHEAEEYGLHGSLFGAHLIRLLLADVNPFTLACERGALNPLSTLYALAMQDIRALYELCHLDIGIFGRLVGQNENLTAYIPNNSGSHSFHKTISGMTAYNSPEALFAALCTHYQTYGCGALADSAMLRFADGELQSVANADLSRLDDIIGYAAQKALLTDNTEAFLNGAPANNVLLAGSRGAGKSTCVKALANEYFERGLRLVELPKTDMHTLPDVLAALSTRGKFFILYIDDLSFDESESEYKHLKSILEGGVVRRPANVLFYATSNRRHIVQEKWSDKNGGYEDETLHATDTRNEKLSLSDRFGLTITFAKPTPQEYFDIVAGLAAREKLAVPEDVLRQKANAWEMTQKNLSGRTARQFVNHMLGEHRQ